MNLVASASVALSQLRRVYLCAKPLLYVPMAKKDLFTPDNIHLSIEGCAVYAERLKPLID